MAGTLESVLANIPGYSGYLAKQQYDQQQGMGELQQAGSLVALHQHLQAAGKEGQFRAALAALGPDATQEQLAQVAAKFSSPDKVLSTQQSSLDRQATAEATRATREASLANAKASAEATHEARMSRLSNEADRATETARHNKVMEQLAAAGGKPPPGYRNNPDGSQSPIPGGPADTKIAGAFNADTANLESSTAGLNRMQASANELLNHPGLKSITGLRGALYNVPGTAAADAQAKLENLKSQVGFSVLQAMRDASKTGGALGNVSDAEGKRLEANLAALQNAQSYDQFRTELQKILTFTEESKGRLRSAYNLKHKDRVPGAAEAPPVVAPGAGAPPAATPPKVLRFDAQGNPVP
jgi:hypothetical protein